MASGWLLLRKQTVVIIFSLLSAASIAIGLYMIYDRKKNKRYIHRPIKALLLIAAGLYGLAYALALQFRVQSISQALSSNATLLFLLLLIGTGYTITKRS